MYTLICGNKMPTRCNCEFLLQILLLAQHVSGTIMPIIRSSRVLYKWFLPVLFGAWFSSCRCSVELRVVCPVCGLQLYCNKICKKIQAIRSAIKIQALRSAIKIQALRSAIKIQAIRSAIKIQAIRSAIKIHSCI
jgi:hypothetical protein